MYGLLESPALAQPDCHECGNNFVQWTALEHNVSWLCMLLQSIIDGPFYKLFECVMVSVHILGEQGRALETAQK